MKLHKLFAQSLFSLILIGSTPLTATDLQDGLVGHWPLNELGAEGKDISGRGHDAIATEVELTEGRGGLVMVFKRKKSELLLPDGVAAALTGDYSLSFWVRANPESGENGPIFVQPDFKVALFRNVLRVTFRNKLYGRTGYADMTSRKIVDGDWHHVVIAYGGGTNEAVIFVDGEEVARNVFRHRPEVMSPITVGTDGRMEYSGELSDLRVYARALDQLDAAALHAAQP